MLNTDKIVAILLMLAPRNNADAAGW